MATLNGFTTLFVATSQGLAVSGDNGVTFVVKTPTNGLGSLNCQDVAVVNQTVYVATDAGLSVSTDNGETFKNYSKENTNGNIPSDNCRKVFASLTSSAVLVSTDGGVALSQDGGNTWTPFTQGANQLPSNDTRKSLVSGSFIVIATALGLGISSDMGKTWTTRLKNVNCKGIILSPLGYGIVATDKGIYKVDSISFSNFEGPISTGISSSSNIIGVSVDINGVIFVTASDTSYYSLDNGVTFESLSLNINGVPVFPTIVDTASFGNVSLNLSLIGAGSAIDTTSWSFNGTNYAANLSANTNNLQISFYSKNKYVPAWANAFIKVNGALIPQTVSMTEINGVYSAIVPLLPGSSVVVNFAYELNGSEVDTTDNLMFSIPPASALFTVFAYKDGVNVNVITKLLTTDVPISVYMNRNGVETVLTQETFNRDPNYFIYSYPQVAGDNSFVFNLTFSRGGGNGTYTTPSLEFEDVPSFTGFSPVYSQSVNTSLSIQDTFTTPGNTVDVALVRYSEFATPPQIVVGTKNPDGSFSFSISDPNGLNYLTYNLIVEYQGILQQSDLQYWKGAAFIPNVATTSVIQTNYSSAEFIFSASNFNPLDVTATLNGVAVSGVTQDPTTGKWSFSVANPAQGSIYSVQFSYKVVPSDSPIQAPVYGGTY